MVYPQMNVMIIIVAPDWSLSFLINIVYFRRPSVLWLNFLKNMMEFFIFQNNFGKMNFMEIHHTLFDFFPLVLDEGLSWTSLNILHICWIVPCLTLSGYAQGFSDFLTISYTEDTHLCGTLGVNSRDFGEILHGPQWK